MHVNGSYFYFDDVGLDVGEDGFSVEEGLLVGITLGGRFKS